MQCASKNRKKNRIKIHVIFNVYNPNDSLSAKTEHKNETIVSENYAKDASAAPENEHEEVSSLPENLS